MRTAGQKKRRIFQRVEIVDTADEGLAIGRCEDGMIILVKGAVPGDTVDAVALEKRKGMFITKVESISTFSSNRTDPFCSHFGTCGGCKWQHMAYGAQLRFKEKKVHDAYQRIGGLDASLIKPIVGAPLETYYRNKLEFTASDRRWLTVSEMGQTLNMVSLSNALYVMVDVLFLVAPSLSTSSSEFSTIYPIHDSRHLTPFSSR